MPRAWWLALLLLSPAEALGVQRQPGAGGTGGTDVAGIHGAALPGRPWSFWEEPRGEKRVLLAIVGLLRTLKAEFWPKLRKNFIEPNEQAGYKFHIVLHTSLSVNCSEKYVDTGRQGWCDIVWRMYGRTPEERRRSLEQLFAPYELQVVDTEDTCWVKPGETRPGDHAESAYLRGGWRDAGCSGIMHFASRGTQVLDALRGKRGFNRVVVVRTDNCFELKGHAKTDMPVLLDEACESHPGVNIVGNLNRLPGLYYGRDYDHSWVLCDGSRADAFRDAVAAFGQSCQAACRSSSAPPCPQGFCIGKMDCAFNLCESARILERGGVQFGTLDDYMIANVQLDGHGNILF